MVEEVDEVRIGGGVHYDEAGVDVDVARGGGEGLSIGVAAQTGLYDGLAICSIPMR